jgi:hypothetical protein
MSLAPLLPVHVSGLEGGLHPKCKTLKAKFDLVFAGVGHVALRM